jgi:hypothetical protein
MLKRSRLLLVAGFVTAVAAGTFVTPASVCATTGGCSIPTFAVVQYMNTTGNNILGDLAFDEGICKEQCDELKNGCTGVVNAAAKCSLASIGADADADERGCAEGPLVSGGGSGECKQSVRAGYKEFQSLIASDKASALDDCQAIGDDCEDSCGQIKE